MTQGISLDSGVVGLSGVFRDSGYLEMIPDVSHIDG